MILGLKDSLSLEEIAKQLEDEESAKGERVLKVSWQGTAANIPLENITSLCIVDSQGKELSEDTAKLRALIEELTENNRKERE